MDRWRRLAEAQLGLVTARQLAAASVTPDGRRALLHNGALIAVHRGVYRVNGSPVTEDQHRLAAILTTDRATLAHRTAAVIWGATIVSTVPEVVLPHGCDYSHTGVIARRTRDLTKVDVMRCGPFPRITRPAMTLVHVADLEEIDDEELEEIGADLLLAWPKERARLKETLNRLDRRGRRGPRRVADIFGEYLADGRRPPHPGLHLDLVRLIRSCDRLPDPIVHLSLKTSIGVQELDLAWPDARLVVEADSARWHSSPDRLRADRRRDQALAEIGWLVLRVTSKELRSEPGRLLETIVKARAARLT